MKKFLVLLVFIPVLLLMMTGCQNPVTKPVTTPVTTPVTKEILSIIKTEDVKQIVIGYGSDNYAASINNQKEIKQLLELFNGATFDKSDATGLQWPYLRIALYEKTGTVQFSIDEKNVIQFEDGNFTTSKQIKFKKLYAIFIDYKSNKK